ARRSRPARPVRTGAEPKASGKSARELDGGGEPENPQRPGSPEPDRHENRLMATAGAVNSSAQSGPLGACATDRGGPASPREGFRSKSSFLRRGTAGALVLTGDLPPALGYVGCTLWPDPCRPARKSSLPWPRKRARSTPVRSPRAAASPRRPTP